MIKIQSYYIMIFTDSNKISAIILIKIYRVFKKTIKDFKDKQYSRYWGKNANNYESKN